MCLLYESDSNTEKTDIREAANRFLRRLVNTGWLGKALKLNEHYNLYMGDVLNKAYKRLKTSDNVSRCRMGIFKQIKTLLGDEKWLDENAGKIGLIKLMIILFLIFGCGRRV